MHGQGSSRSGVTRRDYTRVIAMVDGFTCAGLVFCFCLVTFAVTIAFFYYMSGGNYLNYAEKINQLRENATDDMQAFAFSSCAYLLCNKGEKEFGNIWSGYQAKNITGKICGEIYRNLLADIQKVYDD